MKTLNVPTLRPRYWTALCVASFFGANMGDFFADELGMGNVTGLPFLALALAAVLAAERIDQTRQQVYYWSAIIIVRTAATNFADFTSADLHLSGSAPMLAIVLAAAVWLSWRFRWRGQSGPLRADLGYWGCMFLAGALGTEIGDHCSHWLCMFVAMTVDARTGPSCSDDLGYGGTSLLLSPIVAVLLLVGRSGWLPLIPLYWATVVMIRAAGTAMADHLATPEMFGLPLSTFLTGATFVAVLFLGRRPGARIGRKILQLVRATGLKESGRD